MAQKLEFDLVTGKNNLSSEINKASTLAFNLKNTLTIAAGAFAGNLATKGFDLFSKGVSSAIGFLKDGVAASAETERAFNQLNQALANTGKFSEQTSRELKEFANGLQDITTFGDDAILRSSALIQSLGNLSSQGLQRATVAAADFATVLGTDIESASRLLGQAAQGNIGVLSRYIGKVEEGKTATESFENALAKIEAKFGGAAQAQLRTFSGSFENLQNVVSDAQKSFGRFIVENETVIALFRASSEVIKQFTDSVNSSNQGFDLVTESISTFISIIATTLEVLEAVSKSVQLTAKSFEFLGNALIAVINGPLKLVGEALQFVNDNVFSLGEGLKTFAKGATEPFDKSIKSAENTLKEFNKTLDERGAFGNAADAASNFRDRLFEIRQEIIANGGAIQNNSLAQASADDLEAAKKLNDEKLKLIQDAALAEQEFQALQETLKREQEDTLFQERLTKLSEQFGREEALRIEAAARLLEIQGKSDQAELKRQQLTSQARLKQTQDSIRQEEIAKREGVAAQLALTSSLFLQLGNLAAAGGKQFVGVQKAIALASIPITIAQAVATAQTLPFPKNVAEAARILATGATQIATVTRQSFQDGGIVGANVGASLGGDNTTVNAREGEMFLNAEQQRNLFEMIKSGGMGGDIVIQVDGLEIARAVRKQKELGFAL
jgi:hypothetical protein